ncbi:MAG: DUF3540 domain-containing protein [Polyangiales bacterium]
MEAAAKRELREVLLGVGEVMEWSGSTYRLRTEVAPVTATRAPSCLLAPAVGDEVLYASVAGATACILVITRRAEAGAATLAVEGGLRIEVKGGDLRVCAEGELELVSARRTSVVAPEIDVRAARGSVFVRSVSLFGELASLEFEQVKVIAATVDTVVDRITEHAKRVYRFIEGRDTTRAGTIDYGARENALVRGENTLVTADECVKVDASQIHLG